VSADVTDLAVLEGLQIGVDELERVFLFPTMRVRFDAILHVEVRVHDTHGTVGTGKREPTGTAWREILVDAVLVTDDRMADPRLIGLGVRGYATDGDAPEIDVAPLRARARRVAEAAARVCGKSVIG
jgi:hypothetical protein